MDTLLIPRDLFIIYLFTIFIYLYIQYIHIFRAVFPDSLSLCPTPVNHSPLSCIGSLPSLFLFYTVFFSSCSLYLAPLESTTLSQPTTPQKRVSLSNLKINLTHVQSGTHPQKGFGTHRIQTKEHRKFKGWLRSISRIIGDWCWG